MHAQMSLETHPKLPRLLIVNEDGTLRERLRRDAATLGFRCDVAESGLAAQECFVQNHYGIVLLGWGSGLPDLDTLRRWKSQYPGTVVIVTMSGQTTVESAVEVMKQGAFDLVRTPLELQDLRSVLERAADAITLAEERRLIRETVTSRQSFGNLIGQSAPMERLYRIITKVANSSQPVLIQGESGTGKELVARQIHISGPHSERPFIPVDCGSLVPTLIESELFGYVKGAFTGAVRAKQGLLQIADGGTVLLDEVGEIPIDLQAKLLRALQEKEIRPVGATKTIPLNVRILAATNRDLEQAVQHGSFRKDLYFRLNVVHLRIPPLRERREDIPILIGHFLERINRTVSIERSFAPEALTTMMQYDWPGNVRELENVIERACALTSGPLIHNTDLPTQLHGFGRSSPDQSHAVISIAEMKKHAILGALQQAHGDKMKAAKLLGIGKTTLYRKLKEYRKAES